MCSDNLAPKVHDSALGLTERADRSRGPWGGRKGLGCAVRVLTRLSCTEGSRLRPGADGRESTRSVCVWTWVRALAFLNKFSHCFVAQSSYASTDATLVAAVGLLAGVQGIRGRIFPEREAVTQLKRPTTLLDREVNSWSSEENA